MGMLRESDSQSQPQARRGCADVEEGAPVVLDLPALAGKVLIDLADRLDAVLVNLKPDTDKPPGLVLGRSVRRGNLLVREQDAAVRGSLLEDVALQALFDGL